MRRNSFKKNTVSPLTQKIKAPQHLLRFKDEEDGFDNEWSGRFRLPSLPRQKSWKDDDNILSNENSAATSISWSQEVEDTATKKLEEQWANVEKTLYEEEDDQLVQGSVLDECIQWRTQIPYLRIIGRSSAQNNLCTNNTNTKHDIVSNDDRMKRFDNLQNDKVSIEHSQHSTKREEGEDSTQYKYNIATFEAVLDILMEHVIAEIIPNKENDTDSLCESLSSALKIAPAPVYGNRNSSRNSKTNWTEEAISPNYIENKSLSIRNRLLDTENSLQTIKNDTNYQKVQKKQRSSISANKSNKNKPRDSDSTEDDDASKAKERLGTPHIGRNKLGTIFNERIVVSPVPFAVSTRESFSTLNTIPIRFMNEDLEISSFQGSARNISGDFRGSAKRSSVLRNSNIHSAWQTPVCPTVWPKNIRLAPIDTSRLPGNKNRLFAPSPAILHCNRRPLSPISRSKIPKSAHATRDLEVQGKHIIPSQSKIGLLSAGWDYNSRMVTSKKKKARTTEGS
ncbi:uncharacterized protein LOC114946242 [Nylanderia fulva]|uniref:uncharacterized protein LOC114946242 n=1 Tax=Nylanderia fulva TaxID=613905 RepID=UPI0010FB72F9|nr:uncharacterized protein LOC114946242 [Nylanderia fulva]